MEQILEFKSLVGDAFLTLPLLIISFLLFFGSMTSNVGMLYLFLGHLLIAPALSFLSNEQGPFLYDKGVVSVEKIIKWFVSMVLFLNINASAVETLTGSGLAYILNTLILIPGIGQFIFRSATPFSFLNPVAWFTDAPQPTPGPSNCSMLPGYADKDSKYSTPSTWITHLSFFFGFIFTNALQIFNAPVPTLNVASKKDMEKRQAALDQRVRNRKFISGSILALAIILFSILLYVRYTKTSCESSLLYSLVPILLTSLTGASWFSFVYSKCGIQPADILGIVSGFIDQDLIDNPIVCVGD
jgi:hypothetical protein